MADDAEVFVYTGVGEVAVVLTDVVLVSIDPSIMVIPDRALWRQRKLKDIVLLSGLREIGHQATI